MRLIFTKNKNQLDHGFFARVEDIEFTGLIYHMVETDGHFWAIKFVDNGKSFLVQQARMFHTDGISDQDNGVAISKRLLEIAGIPNQNSVLIRAKYIGPTPPSIFWSDMHQEFKSNRPKLEVI